MGDGRSRSTATSEATKTTSSSDPAGPSPEREQNQQGGHRRQAVEQQLAPVGQWAQARPHEDIARLSQIAGEKDDDPELRELGRLELDRAHLDGEVRAADLVPDAGQPRHQQQRDRGRGDRVAVALEHAVVADEQDRGAEEREPDDEPLRLLARQLGVDPVDHHHAHRREQGGEGEHVGVGVRQPRPDEQVCEHAQA